MDDSLWMPSDTGSATNQGGSMDTGGYDWSGFMAGLLNKATDAYIAKKSQPRPPSPAGDAKNVPGLNGQPVGGQVGGISANMLLIGGAVLFAVLLLKG